MLSDALKVALYGVLAVDVATSGYLLLLTLASLLPRGRKSRSDSPPATRFAIVIPAHDEEAMLPSTLKSLHGQRYPRDRYEVHVIADNCTDSTAEVARSHGVQVHERNAPGQPGKGQALRWLLDQLLNREDIDAFVFVDADTIVEANFLEASDRRLRAGQDVLQASYRVMNPESHPLVSLRALAFALFHDLRGRGKSLLGLSCGLWGNGMVLSRSTVAKIPWESFTAVEDAEQHLKLLLQGTKVAFVPETHVFGHMPASFGAAKTQQSRWEGGRLSLVRRYGATLLTSSLRRRSPSMAAALLELALPPLSVHLMLSLLVVGVSLIAADASMIAIAAACVVALGAYVVLGLLAARMSLKTYASLLYAPVYIAWKLWLFASEMVRRRDPAWVRTARNT